MSNIVKSLNHAFQRMKEKGWDKIYIAVDIHDTIFEGCYRGEETYKWLGKSKDCLQILSEMPQICLLLWSSVKDDKLILYKKKFDQEGIFFDYVNCNPEVPTDDLSDYDGKFYMNLGFDDKFGFEPETDWQEIINYLIYGNERFDFKQETNS